jgi:hypothetical protein
MAKAAETSGRMAASVDNRDLELAVDRRPIAKTIAKTTAKTTGKTTGNTTGNATGKRYGKIAAGRLEYKGDFGIGLDKADSHATLTHLHGGKESAP